jgi:hypothetical protein
VFENRVLREIFGLKGEVTGGRRKLHDEELHNLYSSPDIHQDDQIKKDKMGVACRMRGEKRIACEVVIGKLARKSHLGIDGWIILK